MEKNGYCSKLNKAEWTAVRVPQAAGGRRGALFAFVRGNIHRAGGVCDFPECRLEMRPESGA